jgi:hypothetical protein
MPPDVAPQAADPLSVAHAALGDGTEWLAITWGPPTHPSISLAELVTDGGSGVDRVLAHWRSLNASDPTGPAGVIGLVAWLAFWPQLRAVRESRQLITVDPHGMRFGCFGTDHEPSRIWWPADATVEPIGPDDHDLADAYRCLVTDAVTALTPLVEAVRVMAATGRRGLWAQVVNTFFGVGPDYAMADPATARRHLALMLDACAGTPLAHQPVVLDVPRSDGIHQMVRTTACCLAYLATAEDNADDEPSAEGGVAEERPPWQDGPFAHYCMSCPLIPIEETVLRVNYWLDQRDHDLATAGPASGDGES